MRYRKFTNKQIDRILAEVAKARHSGLRGALTKVLRKHRITHAHLHRWCFLPAISSHAALRPDSGVF